MISTRSRNVFLVVTAIFFTFTGTMHFVQVSFYESIVPPQLPAPLALVYISGVCEILGGIGLLVPPCRRWAGYGLILLLIAVFPANIYMLIKSFRTAGLSISSVLLACRLPLQFILMIWVNWISRGRR